jgi:hypothetical protein
MGEVQRADDLPALIAPGLVRFRYKRAATDMDAGVFLIHHPAEDAFDPSSGVGFGEVAHD